MPKPSVTSKSVLKAKLFHVDEEHIVYPSGKKVIHHTAKRKPVVVIFPVTEKHEIVLVSEYRYMLDKTVLAAAAGFMDKEGETPLQTAKRELKEELGLKANQWELLAKVELASSVFKGEAYLFLVKDLEEGEQALEEDEEISMVKMPIAEAAQKVMTGEISNAASIIGILMVEKLWRERKI